MSARLLFLSLIALCFTYAAAQADVTTCGLITAQGLPCEAHSVMSGDYKLTVNRIANPGKPMVLFAHGLHMNSACWVTNMRDNTLSFLLHTLGFDIWLVNFRGTTPSQSNSVNPPNTKEFWQYSWTEFALHDIPAVVNYMSNVTHIRNVTIVSHSEGGATTFAALSMLPELRARTTLHVALAPAVFVQDCSSPPFVLARDLHVMELLAKVGVSHVGPGSVGHYFSKEVCSHLKTVCELTFSFLAGWESSGNVNKSRAAIYASITDTSSVHNWLHGMQAARSNLFQMFDYGTNGNKEHYGQSTPPPFSVSNVDVPTALYYGASDTLIVPKDIEAYLIPALTHVKWMDKQRIEKFNHADFVWASQSAPFQRMADVIVKANL